MKKIILVNSAQHYFDREEGLTRRADFRLLKAATGKEALLVHQREKGDLIVADLELPDMGGDELCIRVRREGEIRNVSFIIICPGDPVSLERVSRCGANAWIAKPFRTECLLEKIGELITISTRRGYRVLLRARVRGAMDSTTFFCTSHNISVTGMLIETEKLLAGGDQITCMFFLPGSQQIEVHGDVVRSVTLPDGSYHYGIRFVDLSPEFNGVIERFVATAASRG
jgi:DNA-binding response OmpR family regulator